MKHVLAHLYTRFHPYFGRHNYTYKGINLVAIINYGINLVAIIDVLENVLCK